MPKRRNKGDGGLIQRHDHPTCPPRIDGERAPHNCRGRWVGTLNTTEAGRKKTKYVYGRTQKEARIKLDQAKQQKAAGTLVVTSMTVERWLGQWLERKRKPPKPLRPQTWRGYESKIRTWVVPHIGKHRLTALEPAHIEALYDAMREAGREESFVRQVHAILKKALSDAMKRGLLGASPIDRVDAPDTSKNKLPRLDVTEARRVLKHTDAARWWLALFYGMRQGECLGMRWCDVDWTAKTLRIQQTLQTDERGRVIFGPPKSATSRRVIPMLPWVEARMKLHWLDSGSPAVDKPCEDVTGACEHGLAFPRNGRPCRPEKDTEAWRQLLADVGNLPAVELRSARNSASNVMEAAGIPDRLVSQILGHAQVQTTHGYQTAALEQMRDALAGVGRVLELD